MSVLRPLRQVSIAATTLAVLIGAAAICSVDAAATGASGAGARITATPDCHPGASLDRTEFPQTPRIDNRWFPLAPGTNSVLSGTVLGDDGRLHPHKIVSTVSRVTKRLDGITTLVVFERDYEDGALQESELAFVAQDDDGTVWNVGEYPEEYEDGQLAGAPSTWISGIDHARAGISMPARPAMGKPAYLQGSAPSVEFRDCGRVTQRGHRLCGPIRCYNDVLVIDEWAPLEPEGGHQLKYYARGVGVIQVGATSGVNQEVLKLTSRTTLSRAALAAIDRQVLAQDRRGYRISTDVYRRTPRARLLCD
ncbi:MAG: hypothetical protein QOI26_468 [Pseudonocardiales bacterium]|jgi:hypothetical protein|nr:hypothetical protein [Pseudonocardiales bacterium]